MKVRLTPKQIEIAKLVALGYRNRDIAQALGISEANVSSQVQRIAFKLRIDPTRNYRIQIAQFFWELGNRILEQEKESVS